MFEGHLTDCVKTIWASAASAAATTDVDTSVIDMSGYDAVRFVWLLGDVTATSVLQAQLFNNSASSTSSPTPTNSTETTAFTAGASDADSKTLIVDCIRPGGRYVFSRLKRGTANAVVNGCICELYRCKSLPQSADSTVLAQSKDVEGGVA